MNATDQHSNGLCTTANCIIIAQFPIENHSEQGQFAELSLKTIGKRGKWAIIMQFAVALGAALEVWLQISNVQ
jgi:hypothetical protein